MLPFVDAGTLDSLSRAWSDWMMDATLRGSAALAIGGLAAALLRRRSASARHLVWTLGVVGMLALPLLSAVIPAWTTPVPSQWLPAKATVQPQETTRSIDPERIVSNPNPTPLTTASFRPGRNTNEAVNLGLLAQDAVVSQTIAEPTPLARLASTLQGLSFAGWLLLIWETGLLLTLAFFAVGTIRLWWLARHSTRLEHPRWNQLLEHLHAQLRIGVPVELRIGRGAITPMTWGIRRAIVLLPPDALTWEDDVRHDVLLHELTHVQRRDALTQTLAQLACAIHWFNPLVWIATAQMRVERERACDDRVLMAGSKASSYASHLLEMARSLRSENCTAFATLAMARRSQLSDRLVAVLDPRRHRGTPGRFGAALVVLLALVVVVPLAAWSPVAAEAPYPPVVTAEVPRVAAPPIGYAYGIPSPEPPRGLSRQEYAQRHAELHDHGECVFEHDQEPIAPRVAAVPYPVAVVGAEPYAVVAPAPSAPAFAVAQGSRAHSRNSIPGRLQRLFNHQSRSNWTISVDGYKMSVEMEGKIEFNDDESAIASMDDDAWFELEEREGRDRRRVTAESENGEIVYTFYEGRREIADDAKAREWLAETLPKLMRNMGIGVDGRVERIYEQGGADALIEEMHELRSDHALGIYLSETMALEAASAADKKRILGEFLGEIESDFELANFLIAIDSDHLDDADFRIVYFDAVGNIDSDFERGRVLANVLDHGHEDGQTLAFVLQSVDDIDSDFESANILTRTAPLFLENEENLDGFFDAVADVDSDFERGRILKTLMSRGSLSDPAKLRLLEAIEDTDSEFERTNLLIGFSKLGPHPEELQEKLMQAIDTIRSDHEYGRAMKAARSSSR